MVSENGNWNGMANDFPSHVFLYIDILFHPCQSDKSVFEKKLGGDETNTDSTDFIRDGVLSEKEFQHTLFVTP